MFKDTDEALARLEAELLREEEYEKEYDEEEYEEYDDTFEEEAEELPPENPSTLSADLLYDDTRPAAGPVVYQNFSNNYGHVYNSDVSDEDLDAYSEEVLQADEEKNHSTALLLLACVLSLGIVAVLLYVLFLYRGGL